MNPKLGPAPRIAGPAHDASPVLTSSPNQYLSTMDGLQRAEHSWFVQSRQERSTVERPLVSIVDDDESVRESLPDLLKEFGFTVLTFSSADEFLASDSIDRTMCLILDVAMPGMSGLDLQKELKRRGYEIPVVFITGQNDESVRIRCLEQGAVDVLFKPFSDIALRKALSKAMGRI